MAFGKWLTYLISLSVTVFLFLVHPIAAKSTDAVSPALEILAHNSIVSMATYGDRELGFEAEDFERALNVSQVTSIVIQEVPSRSDGILYLGDNEVHAGQIISRANIPYLKFVFMNTEIQNSKFCFSTNLGNHHIPCSVYALTGENLSPIISSANQPSFAVGTFCDVTFHGKLDAYDPEGDVLVYEIVSYPEHGLLVFNNERSGDYRYIPEAGYSGRDSFCYVAVDQYGNYSGRAEVVVDVARQGLSLTYCDLENSTAHVAAISLTERGIMASSTLNGQYYFYPQMQVTRSEFLVMTMQLLGIKGTDDGSGTVFADDSEIPLEHRSYVNMAQKLGYVCGRINKNGELIFAPNEGITRAEAALMVYNMVSLDIPVIKPLFVDGNTVPPWAKDAVYSAVSSGILTYKNGYVAADEIVDRGQCAEMLYAVSQRLD